MRVQAIGINGGDAADSRGSNCGNREWSAMLVRIQSEFREMPGMYLTTAQAARLWSLDLKTAETLLAEFVERGVLRRTSGERYVRA
jgi:hypothetical protein